MERICSSFSLKNVTRKSEKLASSGTAVRIVVKASEPARSSPRSARKPRHVSRTMDTSDQLVGRLSAAEPSRRTIVPVRMRLSRRYDASRQVGGDYGERDSVRSGPGLRGRQD